MTRGKGDIFSTGFSFEPWWWKDARPGEDEPAMLPPRTEILVIGSGYAGICCALRLARSGRDVTVVDADGIGFNASTRSGGQVTAGVNVGKSFAHRPISPERRVALLGDASKGMRLFEELLDTHGIDCDYHANGRIVGLWSKEHAGDWSAKIDEVNAATGSNARLIGREETRVELGSDFYWGGVMIGKAGHIQPAKYHAGLLRAARSAGVRFHGRTPVSRVLRQAHAGPFAVVTSRGTIVAEKVVYATNAYTGLHAYGLKPDLRRGIIPVNTQMIATQELSEDMARTIIPNDRGVSESRRVIAHFRKSPDGRRLLFGGRASFLPLSLRSTSQMLYAAMLERFPQLQGIRIDNAWSGKVAMTIDRLAHMGGGNGEYFVAGCQGSGITLMTYLGTSVADKILARADDVPINAFDTGLPPHHPLYDGTAWFMPVVGSWYQIRDRLERRVPN